jgi:hypothetical protein
MPLGCHLITRKHTIYNNGTLFLFTLHVSTLMAHHQVFTVTHNLLSNYNATFVHLHLEI